MGSSGAIFSNAGKEWAKAAKEIDKRSREKVATALGKALTKATETERKKIGNSFREQVSSGAPSHFATPEIRDPLVKVRLTTSTRYGSKATARIRESGPHDFRRWNQGLMRHPVFGNREKWAETAVPEWKSMWSRSTRPVKNDVKETVAHEMDAWFQNPK